MRVPALDLLEDGSLPTYAYRCRDCGHDLEVQQSFSDATLTECSACGGDLRKLFSPVGITFKGGGFYKTDSRSRSKTSSSSSSSSNGDASSSSSGSDSSSSSTSTPSSAPAAAAASASAAS